MKIFFKKLHLWLSVPFGIVIAITCFTGALLVFETEITNLCNGGIASVEPAGTPLPLDELALEVESSLPGGSEILGFVVPANPSEAYMVNLSKPVRKVLYVNQYTGEVKGEKERLPFFKDVVRLHRFLLDTNSGNGTIFWGKLIVGTSTLLFLVILVTGIVLWWPRNRKMLKNRLLVAIGKGRARFWYDFHVTIGFYASLFLLVMALTGLNWSFEWYRNGFYSLLGAETTSQAAPKKNSAVAVSGSEVQATTAATSWSADASTGATAVVSDAFAEAPMPWQAALDSLIARTPCYSKITITKNAATVSLGTAGNSRASDKYTFDEETGEITSCSLYEDVPYSNKLRGWVYSLHVGSWGGMFTRVLAFLAALHGATLPLTGYYLWVKRLYGRRKSRRN